MEESILSRSFFKDIHPHMADLYSTTTATSYGAHFQNIKSSSKVLFIISNSKQTPYSVIASQGPQIYLLFIPRSFSSTNTTASIPSLGPSWEHIRILYNGIPSYKVVSLLFESQIMIEAHVPFNLDDFFKYIANKRLIFLPYEQLKDLHRSNTLTQRGTPLISQALSINKLRVYDVDVSQPVLYSHLFHHLKDRHSVLQVTSRNKTIRHLKMFFSHFKLVANSRKMENAIFMRSQGDSSQYLRIFMTIMKRVVDESKETMALNVSSISKERLELRKRQEKESLLCPPKRLCLIPNKVPRRKPNVFLNLVYDPIVAHGPLICHKCYRLQLSEESLMLHWAEKEEYRNALKSFVSSFWTPAFSSCYEKKCSKETSSLEEMIHHVGFEHKFVFKLFLEEAQKGLRPCLIRNCTFLTLGVESLLNHMVFSHFYDSIYNDLNKIQTIQQFSKTQCPFYECQKFLMKEKLLTHFSLEHGVFMDYLQKPFMNEVELLPYYYEYMIYGYIKSQFKPKYTCDLIPCRSRRVFSCILSYFLHLTERHYFEELKSLFGDMEEGKCIYDTCKFYSTDSQVSILHLGVYHEIVLFLDTKKRGKDFSRYNVHLLRMYDNIWRLGKAPMYSCGSKQQQQQQQRRGFASLALLHVHLCQLDQGVQVRCETCSFTLPSLSNSDSFYIELIYHSISKEHILNQCIIFRDGNRYEPSPVSRVGILFCPFCNVVPDENHHMFESHQELLFIFSKFMEFCSLRGVMNPMTCALNEIVNFLKYMYHTKKAMDPQAFLEMLSRLHEKGNAILTHDELSYLLSIVSSTIPKTHTLFTCFSCIFFAPSHKMLHQHFVSDLHKKNVVEERREGLTHYIRCEACNLFFKLHHNAVIDVHRHSRSHLGYAFNIENESIIVPIKKRFPQDSLYDCSLCHLKLSSSKCTLPHATSPAHLEAQGIADAFYSHCSRLQVNPVTCDVSFLKSFLLQYDKIALRAKVWTLLHRIHSGMDLAKVHFASDPDLLICEYDVQDKETISIIC